MDVDDVQEVLDGIYRETLYEDDPSEEFIDGMVTQWGSPEGIISLSRNAIATNTNHTTEIDPADVTARTLLLWGAADEFQPISSAERLEDDIDSAELVGLEEATHWVMEDRPDAYHNRLERFLDGG